MAALESEVGCRRRGRQKETLAAPDAKASQRIELLAGLDALGGQPGAYVSGKSHQGTGQRPPDGVGIDALSQCDVQLDDVGPHMKDMPQAREARSGVVHGKPNPLGLKPPEAPL